MKKILVLLFLLLLGLLLASCTLPTSSAMEFPLDFIGISDDESIEVSETLPKLPTPEDLAVDENEKIFSWNSVSHISSYHVRIAGLDRVRRKIIDYNYKVNADTPYFSLPQLKQGEYFLLVKAMGNNEEYLSSDWSVMEYRIGVEAPSGTFVDCHNDWSGFYSIFESTEDTEGLEARFCLTCFKSQVIRNAALPSKNDMMIFTLINGGTEYSVRANAMYTEKPYEEVIIPSYHKGKAVTVIGNFGFYRMLKLKKVVIPNTITKIGYGPFASCPNLETIQLDEDNTNYKIDGDCLIEINTNKIISGTINSVIPSYITDIGSRAFYGLNIKSVIIPASVIEVGDAAFTECTELISVEFIEGSKLDKISLGMFGGCTSLKNIVLPNSIETIDDSAFELCTSLVNLTIPINCTYIGAFVFSGWESSQTIYFTGFSSLAEANNAFHLHWNTYDFYGADSGAKLVFLG